MKNDRIARQENPLNHGLGGFLVLVILIHLIGIYQNQRLAVGLVRKLAQDKKPRTLER